MPFSTAILRISEGRKIPAEAYKRKAETTDAGIGRCKQPRTTTLEPLLGLRTGKPERKQESTHGASF
jgi:hypothetical protein